jgi:photosystem II stability/assembly factor-like uncharacterized protein
MPIGALAGWLALLAQLAPVEPQVRVRGFVSVSCPRPDACLLLDRMGGLFFSADGGQTLLPRAELGEAGIRRIHFAGLLRGWGVDAGGDLWWSRDGGRRFQPLGAGAGWPRGEQITALAAHPDGGLWLGCASGAVYRLAPGGGAEGAGAGPGRVRRGPQGPDTAVVGLAPAPDGALVVLFADGRLLRAAAAGERVERGRALAGRAHGLVRAGSTLVASGCRGRVRFSADGGASWQAPASGPEPPTCLRPVGALGGRAVLAGLAGQLLLAEAADRRVSVLPAGPQRHWRAAARRGQELLLVGDGGAIGKLLLDAAGPRYLPLSETRPGLVDVRTWSQRRALRAYSDGRIDLSADRGRSWRSAGRPGADLRRADFVDPKHGFAIRGAHQVLGTADGGRSWQVLGRWNDLALHDLDFIDRQRGWLVGGGGALLRTTDGGHSWTLDRTAGFDRSLFRVRFVDPRRGFAVGEKRSVFRTRDGGASWQRLSEGRARLHSLCFLDARRGWVGGDGGLVQWTADAGQSWKQRPVPTAEPIRALAFADRLRGLAGAAGGRLWATRDGGRHWRRIELGLGAGIFAAACFAGSDRCLVGGEKGLLLLGDPFGGGDGE